ncbi:RHS repeat-associated core domain-containing protein [Fibrobacter sp. UWH5]|uniref:RHS repeat domain-containing protein n=1 Tax=Fibrobacter sp. UWH5 TaxID=1896211 RepID=UPI00090FDE7D|nr:RHS repeat-associated core domain-containing protein [Fibrobacter sp. UWH5]SHL53497.1 RHS repeat-associated core domain-containing protein [Fibrobacter sp. UWH5]
MSYAYYPTGNVKTVRLGNNVTIDYTYHISGAVKTATAKNADGKKLFEEELYYEDCGNHNCVPQYNGNISYMVHELAANGEQKRSSKYVYDFMNRLTSVEDSEQDMFNEYFKYDEQGRIVSQRRGQGRGGDGATGGEYGYYANTNRLEKVSGGMGGMSAANRDMSASENFVYDAEGNLIEDKSKNLKISYDWRGMPVEFRMESKSGNVLENTRSCSRDSVRVLMAYDGTGRRVSKTRERKACLSETSTGANTSERTYAADWERELVTHYTGIGTEVRESFHNGTPSETKVVVNMPQGLGRYGVEDATNPFYGVDKMQLAGYIPSAKFEWFLKNHLGSTMLVYGTSAYNDTYFSGYKGGVQAAYDYRAFGEQVTLSEPTDKVTENFTGKEKDDETELNYFGARYLDPMLGLWISVDPKRQFSSPYLYAGNGMNPVNGVDGDGNIITFASKDEQNMFANLYSSLTIEAKSNIAVLSASKNVYNLNFREPQQTMVFEDTYGDPIKNKTSYGKFEPNATGAEIYFDGTAKSLGHELGGHGFQYEQILNIFLENGIDGQGAANLFKNTYNVNEEWRTGIEKEAARIGGHEYDSKAYEDFD